ncbi:glycoside hydrolase family 95 protein [Alteromonas gilva]|uniref:Glycoside hydrolase family 95 protein n=1 Tax=Alteromonas gilva TaxID=2987522 RepID=A0ABT5KYF7_9ALTE|nr:glycoside hydrolase family 95 protein [Alteromonas gilva]MDC8829209.1 glycoside hydrolase family 95 protein [Alteromonas gilva]
MLQGQCEKRLSSVATGAVEISDFYITLTARFATKLACFFASAWLVLCTFSLFSLQVSAAKSMTLSYTQPGQDWESESLPLGNGHLGMTVLGGVQRDALQFNEKTLWTGGPGSKQGYNFGFPQQTETYLKRVQSVQAALTSKGQLAPEQVAEQLGSAQSGYGSYQSFGTLTIDWPASHGSYHHYQRELDIASATAAVRYQTQDSQFVREYFVSYPDNSIVIRLSASGTENISFKASLKFPENRTRKALQLSPNEVLYAGVLHDNTLQYAAGLRVLNSDGTLTYQPDGGFSVDGASEVVLVLTAATNYALQHPTYRGEDATHKVRRQLGQTRGVGYATLKQNHLADYQPLFKRVELDLGGAPIEDMAHALAHYPGDEQAANRALEQLYFQYGRYLLIASSRQGSLPANLQGIWNKDIVAPWNADYHLNINLQMNYWLALSTNLAETLPPLYNFVENLTVPGQQAASTLFDSRGWVAFLNTNPWGSIGLIKWPTAFWQPEAAAWIALHFYHGYQYNQDRDFLAERVYPLLKLTSQFWLDNLTTATDNNRLLVSPSYSPEHGNFTVGAAMSQQLVFDLLSKTYEAAGQLNDTLFREELATALNQLEPGLRIGQWGQLQEWREDIDEQDNQHRHVSHLYALHPGNQISPLTTPHLAAAASTSLNARGDAGTGWSRAWKVNFWARLLEGDRALRLLRHQLRDSTLANLWSTHPPFQIDGNFGATAGMAEMLLQSHLGELHLLPALPTAWGTGKVTGLRAQGDLTVSMAWQNNTLQSATIVTGKDAQVRLRNRALEGKVTITSNQHVLDYQQIEEGVISFISKANQEYVVLVGNTK